MKKTDYILIARGENLYRAQIAALSSVLCFEETRNSISAFMNEVSAFAEDMASYYSDAHFSKTELKNSYASKDEVSSLTANQTYVLASAANTERNSLSSMAEVRAWFNDEVSACAEMFVTEMSKMTEIMGADAGEHTPSEYSILPEVQDLVVGTKKE